jgi:hypothetical protein
MAVLVRTGKRRHPRVLCVLYATTLHPVTVASAEVLGSLFAMHTMDAHMGLLCTGSKQTREIEVNKTATPSLPPFLPLFSAFCGEVMMAMMGKEEIRNCN